MVCVLERTLGHGAFGQVCYAKLLGVSSFNPRKALNEKTKRQHFSFELCRKRTSHFHRPNVTEVAVKMLNGRINTWV